MKFKQEIVKQAREFLASAEMEAFATRYFAAATKAVLASGVKEPEDLTDEQLLRFYQDFWDALPDSAALHDPINVAAFSKVCRFAEAYCFEGEE